MSFESGVLHPWFSSNESETIYILGSVESMFHTKDVLSNQLLANANDPSWYVSFKEAVEDLSEEEAFWNPNDECNSIAEIVQHLLYWNETWQARI